MEGKRISPVTASFIIGTALIFDGLQFILTLTVFGSVLSWFIAMIAWIIFFIWFALLGVNYASGGGKKLAAAGASLITELIPLIDALPALTLGVTTVIIQHNIEVRKKQNLPVNPRNSRRTALRARLMAQKVGLADAKRPVKGKEA